MKFFVDSAEIDQIAELNDLGMVDGVTTNPSLIKKSGRDIVEVTKEICSIVSGPVSAEVTATEADKMIAEGRKLGEIADNIAVKVPLTSDTFDATLCIGRLFVCIFFLFLYSFLYHFFYSIPFYSILFYVNYIYSTYMLKTVHLYGF